MKLSAVAAALAASVTTAQPLAQRQASTDTEDGWGPILNGDNGAVCSELAVIFARGTFDPGNIGPWVGAPFRDALTSKHGSVSFQGVSTGDYPADLAGYIVEGGSQTCADSLGSAVQKYSESCPDAKIVISGWSQGCLCARKSLANIGGASDKLAALVCFGDPASVWENSIDFPPLPSQAADIGFCKTAPTDPLCGSPADNWPSDPIGVIDHLKEIWGAVDEASMNDAQKSALGSMVLELPKQATKQLATLGQDLINGNLQRWMLTPEHFWYGMDGSTETAADEIIALL